MTTAVRVTISQYSAYIAWWKMVLCVLKGCLHWECLLDSRKQRGTKWRTPSHEDADQTSGVQHVPSADWSWRLQVRDRRKYVHLHAVIIGKEKLIMVWMMAEDGKLLILQRNVCSAWFPCRGWGQWWKYISLVQCPHFTASFRSFCEVLRNSWTGKLADTHCDCMSVWLNSGKQPKNINQN